MIGKSGEAVLIDPSVYYGVGEVDLAMTDLFGGFDQKFYAAYQSVRSLSPGWRERLEIYKLYPLLVHVDLFGGGYLAQIQSILKRFV